MRTTATLGAALALAGLLPTASHAGRLAWAGKVDGTTIVRVHKHNVSTEATSGKGVTSQAYFVTGSLDRRVHRVFLRHARGRGSVRLIQQPGPYNGYTAAVRISDPQPGRAPYHFTLIW